MYVYDLCLFLNNCTLFGWTTRGDFAAISHFTRQLLLVGFTTLQACDRVLFDQIELTPGFRFHERWATGIFTFKVLAKG